MRFRRATWIWTAALVCVASSRVLAQADEGLLSITVAVPLSDRVAVTEDARRLYVESDELHLDVSVVNPSDSRITIDQEQLQRAFRVALTAGGTSRPVVDRLARDGPAAAVWLSAGTASGGATAAVLLLVAGEDIDTV